MPSYFLNYIMYIIRDINFALTVNREEIIKIINLCNTNNLIMHLIIGLNII
jgi:hypothetical protein